MPSCACPTPARETVNADASLASRTAYCSNDEYSYSEGTQHLPTPECAALLPGELTQKTTSSVFFTSAYMETVTRAWPCDTDLNGTRANECTAAGGLGFLAVGGRSRQESNTAKKAEKP